MPWRVAGVARLAQGTPDAARRLRSSNVSGVNGDWHPYPGATDVGASRLAPVDPGRVVGLGAVCDLGQQRSDGTTDQSFSVSEFATLEDGRRVLLHEDRGFTLGWRSSAGSGTGDVQKYESLESLTREVLNVVLPDDDECAEDHPWSWLAELARARGLNVTAEDLRGLPYEVIFAEKVRRWLRPD